MVTADKPNLNCQIIVTSSQVKPKRVLAKILIKKKKSCNQPRNCSPKNTPNNTAQSSRYMASPLYSQY